MTGVIEKIKSLNARIRDYARKNKFQYVGYWSALANERGAMHDGISKDGCHPTAEGYAIMGPLVQQAIKEVVK